MANHFAYIYVKIIFNSIQLLSLLCLSQTHTSLHSYKEIKSEFTEQASNTEDRNITVPAQHNLWMASQHVAPEINLFKFDRARGPQN